MDDARNVIAVLVRHDDELCGRERAFDLRGRVDVERLLDTAAEKAMDLLVHACIDHDSPVGIDHLKRRTSLDARLDCGDEPGPASLTD